MIDRADVAICSSGRRPRRRISHDADGQQRQQADARPRASMRTSRLSDDVDLVHGHGDDDGVAVVVGRTAAT